MKTNRNLPKGKSLAEKCPDLIPFWSPNNEVTPWEVGTGLLDTVLWICPIHGEYEKSLRSVYLGHRCKKCSNHDKSKKAALAPYLKSLAFLYPDIAATWSTSNTCSPNEVYAYAGEPKRYWICTECGEDYKRTCRHRHSSSLCKGCAYSKAARKLTLPTPFHSFADLYPELLKEYSKENTRNPYSLKPHASYYATWTCLKCKSNWEAWVYNRTSQEETGCPHCFKLGQYSMEQNLRTSLIPFGASSNSNTKLGNWSVDIYFPDSKTIIEYDGSHWHSFGGSWERDRRKSLELLAAGYRVIRVRTYSKNFILKSLEINNPSYFEVFYQEPRDSKPSEDLINSLTDLLSML